jgi:hypothetical protein
MHNIVVIATKVAIHATMYIVVICNEMMMIDIESWIKIHTYLVEGFKCIPILLNLERLVNGGTVKNFTNMILKSMMVNGGLTMEDISSKQFFLVLMWVVVFTNVHSGVTTQITKKAGPFMLTIYCVAHQTNPSMQTFFMQPLVHKLEGLLQATHTYFSSSPKKHLVPFVFNLHN